MKKRMILWTGLFSVLLLAGCMTSNPTTFTKAMAQDKATWKIHVMTPYGSGDYVRIGAIPGQMTTVNSDGSISVFTPKTNSPAIGGQ